MESSVAFRALRINISACGVFCGFFFVMFVWLFTSPTSKKLSLYFSDELSFLENVELEVMAVLDLLSFVRNLDSINLCRGCIGKTFGTHD